MEARIEQLPGYESRSKIVLDKEVSDIRLLLEAHAGVQIDSPTEILSGILQNFLLSHDLSSAGELISAMRARPVECERLLEVLLPGDTAFFRDTEVFATFKSDVLPAIRARKNREPSRPLRIWCAGCSTGEEAYSIGISLCESFQDQHTGWNAHIVAGDIRRDALKSAERGLYPAHALSQIHGRLKAAYFSRVGDHLLVKPRLRNLITFTYMNLSEPSFIGRFDVIFCLEVLPQLSTSGRAALLQRLHLALEPGGYVFLGHNEHFPATVSLIRHTAPGCIYYQRPLASAAKAGK